MIVEADGRPIHRAAEVGVSTEIVPGELVPRNLQINVPALPMVIKGVLESGPRSAEVSARVVVVYVHLLTVNGSAEAQVAGLVIVEEGR